MPRRPIREGGASDAQASPIRSPGAHHRYSAYGLPDLQWSLLRGNPKIVDCVSRHPSRWFLLVLLVGTTPIQAQTFVTTKAVRLRHGPSTSERIIRVLGSGER